MSTPQPPPGPYAFVSYASADGERVLLVVAALRGAGVPVWLDEQGIAGGENYAREIAEAIKGAAAFLLLASPAALASRNVRQEVALAWRYERPYVPLRLDPVAIPDDLAYWLEAAQWVDVLDRPTTDWLPAVLVALAPHGIAPPAPSPAPEPLAGRAREQALLRDALGTAIAGHGGLVLVGGEAGVGKTTLAEALLAEAVGQGALTLIGHCYDLAETPPYGPWVDLFARYRPGPEDPPHPAAFAQRGTVGAVASQAALVTEVRDWLAALAARRPVVLLLDDLHWADPASLDLLRAVARDLADLPVLLLATYRDDELTRRHPLYALLPNLEREAHARRLDLRRFDDGGVRALLTGRYALPDADAARLVAWLLGRAEGNAFFTAQLLRALEEERVLRADSAGWALGDLGAVGLPAPLRQVLDARLARLGEAPLRLLALAAVVGQEVPLALWAVVAETDEDGLLDTVERATDAHLLAESPDGAAVHFTHALIREALYQGLLAARRRRVHRRAGEAYLATPRPDPDAVAHHLRQAGDPRAAEWLVAAGERARRSYAWLTAAARFEAALPLLGEEGQEGAARARLLLRLSQLLRYASPARALAYVEDAARWAARAGDAQVAAITAYLGGLLRCFAGELRRGIGEVAAGIDAMESLPPVGAARQAAPATGEEIAHVRSQVHAARGTLAMWLAYVGRYAEARSQAERGVADAPEAATVADFAVSSHADGYLALLQVRAMLGDADAARRAYERARDLYRAVGHLVNAGATARAALVALALPYHADDLAWRRHLADEADEAFLRAGESLPGYRPGLARVPLLLLAGDWAAAAQIDEAGALPPWLHTDLGELARARGDAASAWRMVQEMSPDGPDAEPGGAMYLRALAGQRLAAALALDAHDPATARAWLAAHDRWLAWSGAVLGRAEGALGWAAYHRAAGDLALAYRCAEESLAQASAPRQPLALLAAHRLLGELATEAGHFADAAPSLGAALALADACAAPYERALTLLALAELRAAEGAHEVARTALDGVRAICTPLAAAPALARADALGARLAASPPAPAALPFGLTAREAEVLTLVGRGLSDAQVAERLFLSRYTVKAHMRAVYNKLGTSSRTAAARLALEHGLT